MKPTKNIFIKIAAVLVLAGLSMGCKKQLNYIPESYLSPQDVYSDAAGATAAITGIYRQLEILKKSELGLIGNIGTDEGKTTTFVPGWGGYWLQLSALSSYDNIQLSAQNDPIFYYWQQIYLGIGNANTAIKSLPKSPIDEALKNRLLGEAKFFRGLFYFYLVQLFGPVPMPTDVPDAAYDKDGYPRSAVEDVYQLITDDLKFAVANLAGKSAMGKGKTNKQAAEALLGKVYLTLKDYTNAKAVLEPLMTDGDVSLLNNYGDLFTPDNENNAESLFEIQYTSETNYTQNFTEILGGWAIDSKQPGGGGQVAICTDYAANIFPEEDAQRKNATLRSVYYDPNTGDPDYLNWWADVGKPHIKKYEQQAGQPSNSSSRNIYLLRYADAILMYAEALNELGETSQALTYVNKIRTRAQISGFETALGHDPSQEELRNGLVEERMKELMFEGWRWFDLKRWGLLISRTKQYDPDATNNITDPKHLLYPIPYKEFVNNRTLQPSDQNSGY